MDDAKRRLYDEKAEGYFDQPREELVARVPPTARRVLEVGCGAGATGEALKLRLGPDARVYGIEIALEAARRAQGRMDDVRSFDIEEGEPPEEWLPLDALLFGDVLEHLVDPWRLLERARDWLSPQGVVVASIPNLGYWKAALPLVLADDFAYQPSGVLDRSHLRFFTAKTIRRLFTETGYTLQSLKGNPLGVKGNALNLITFGLARRLLTTQYHVTATLS